MIYKTVNYNKIINIITHRDILFNGDYIIDPYQNCEFGCKYCDSSNDEIIYIKNNLLNKVRNEIKNLSKGRFIIGSVVDPYQPIEKKFGYTRELLKIIKKHNFEVHILTKSDLVLRDLDILSEFRNASITISIVSLNEKISGFFENKVPSSKKRLEIVKKFSDNSINSGLAIIPILPYFIEEDIKKIVKYALKYESNYLLFKHLELKGFQKQVFYDSLIKFNNEIYEKYVKLFNNKFNPDKLYIQNCNIMLNEICKKYNITHIIK